MIKIKAVLFDLDGTLYFKGSAIEGACNTVAALRKKGYKMRFLTNTDSKSTEELHKRIISYGFGIFIEEIHTPVIAVIEYIKTKDNVKVFPLVSSEVEGYFTDYLSKNGKVDYVIVGDFRDKVDYNIMNEAFRYIDDGAEILALQNGRYFYNSKGKNLNTGAFVKLLEYASNKESTLIGKPNREFFMSSIKAMNLKPNEIMVVGDGITTDIKGAINLGAISVLVKTGKFSDDVKVDNSNIKPDYIIDSVADVEKLLDQIN